VNFHWQIRWYSWEKVYSPLQKPSPMTTPNARSGEPENNGRHRPSGHLLGGRYRAIPVEADPHLAELSRYPHLNSVRIRAHFQKGIAFRSKDGARAAPSPQDATRLATSRMPSAPSGALPYPRGMFQGIPVPLEPFPFLGRRHEASRPGPTTATTTAAGAPDRMRHRSGTRLHPTTHLSSPPFFQYLRISLNTPRKNI
jgi:hypothetical protein